MARKLFEVKPGKPGAAIEWKHVRSGGAVEIRTGVIVGQAPQLGLGHKSEMWVVPDDGGHADIYPGGVVVAVRAKGSGCGFGLPSFEQVSTGELFSDDGLNAATGSMAVMNWRRSAASTYGQKAA